MSEPAPEQKAARLLSPQPLEEEEEDNDDDAAASSLLVLSGPPTEAPETKEEEQSGDEDDDEQSPSPAAAISRAVLPVPRRATALLPVAVPVDPPSGDVPTALPVVGMDSVSLYVDDDDESSPSPPVAAPAGASLVQQGRRRRVVIAAAVAVLLLLALIVGLSVGLTSNNNKPPGAEAAAPKPPPPSASSSSTLPPDPDHFAYNDPPNCTDPRAVLNTCAGTAAANNASNANASVASGSSSDSDSSGEPAGPCETCVVQYFGGVVGLTLNLSDAWGAFRCEQIDDETCAALDACTPGPCSGTCAQAFLASLACESACPSEVFPCWQSA
jgi:hypothetical protein